MNSTQNSNKYLTSLNKALGPVAANIFDYLMQQVSKNVVVHKNIGLANALGITMKSLSANLKKLREYGLIEMRRFEEGLYKSTSREGMATRSYMYKINYERFDKFNKGN